MTHKLPSQTYDPSSGRPFRAQDAYQHFIRLVNPLMKREFPKLHAMETIWATLKQIDRDIFFNIAKKDLDRVQL